MHLSAMLDLNARRHPEKEFVVYGDRRWTYGAMNEKVNRVANALIARGVRRGEKVAIFMRNSDDFVAVYFGILRAGAVAVPVNFNLTPPEAGYIFDHSDSVGVFFDAEYEDLIDKARPDRFRFEVAAHGRAQHRPSLDDWLEGASSRPPGLPLDEDDDAQILYTSGTTGKPKGALFTHRTIVTVGITIDLIMGIRPDERLACVAPLFHSAQLDLFLVGGTYVGATHVIHRAFDPEAMLRSIQDERITLFFGVPTMYNFMARHPAVDRYDLSSLRHLGYGAAPMAPELVRLAMEKLRSDQFYNLCGLTEAGPGGVYLGPEDHRRKLGASGRAMLNAEVRVVDDDGRDVPPGGIGEMVIRGATLMKEYYKNPEATAEAMRGGWLHTGDLARIDDEGYLTLVDRKKDMIITGGENVYSVEVEQVLHSHPSVLEAAVIGVPNPVWGETVMAVVALRPGTSLTLDELRNFCADQLARYKIPRLLEIVDRIPRNASGKVLKYQLREQYRERGINATT